MLTREEIEKIDRECAEQHLTQQEYLSRHGIARHNYYRWKRRYKEEDGQSLVPAGFVPLMPGTSQPVRSGGKVRKSSKSSSESESFLSIEIRTSGGSAMRIQGNMTAAHLRELICASNV